MGEVITIKPRKCYLVTIIDNADFQKVLSRVVLEEDDSNYPNATGDHEAEEWQEKLYGDDIAFYGSVTYTVEELELY